MRFSNDEYQIMEKYREARVINEEDEAIIDRFRSSGWVNIGYRDGFDPKNPHVRLEIRDTAVLTEEGMKLYVFERQARVRERNPIRKLLSRVLHSV